MMTTPSQDWEIPRKVWHILMSWGMAVLMIAGLLSFWIWRSGKDQTERAGQLQLEQDRAMCTMMGLFLNGPDPAPGPEGDRSRVIRRAMLEYQRTLHCEEIRMDPDPVRPR